MSTNQAKRNNELYGLVNLDSKLWSNKIDSFIFDVEKMFIGIYNYKKNVWNGCCKRNCCGNCFINVNYKHYFMTAN